MEIQLIIVLLIAFVVLGPERMMDLAVKLGESLRKVREMWDEVRMQAYMEEINKKVLEEESKGSELDERTEDETVEVDEPLPDIELEEYEDIEEEKEEREEDEHGQRTASDDAPHGTSEGAQDKIN